MYAIIEDSGAQRSVRKDEVILTDLVDGGQAKAGQKVSFAKVLLLLFLVAFLQWKPKGLVVTRSRALEDA